MGKKWYTSKTIYINAVAFLVMIIQLKYGWTLPVAIEGVIMGIINLVLRRVTKEPVVW